MFSRRERAAALDLVAGGDDGRLAHAADALTDGGDYAMALEIAELGLAAHAASAPLAAARARALDGLRAKFQFSPFELIVYSEKAGVELPPPPSSPVPPSASLSPAAPSPIMHAARP